MAADTALHIAARHGKAIFAAEVAILNPDLAKKLNHNGHTPLHIALKSKHWKTALALTALDVELIRVKGSGGKTALHVAAEIAPARLLAEFLCICPSSLEDITSRKETAVHRALKKKNFRNFEVLYKWMLIERKEYLLEWKDFRGNTALHVAVAKWNTTAAEDVKNWKKVLKIVAPYVPRETTNFKGKTAAQLLSPQTTKSADDKEVRRLLTQFNIMYEVDNYLKRHFLKTTIIDNLEMKSWFEKRLRFLGFPDVRTPAGEKSRGVVLLVATLIATATYQTILTPPGGYWQEDYPAPTARLDSKAAPAPAPPHNAGQMIMDGMTLFSFTATNAVAFCFALAAIVLNVAQLKQATLMMVAAYVLLFSYMFTTFLSTMMGKDKNWGKSSVLPLFLTVTGLFYGFMGSYVALHNKYGTVMDSSARGSIPVLDGPIFSDEKDSDEKSDDDDEEEHVELLSMKVGD